MEIRDVLTASGWVVAFVSVLASDWFKFHIYGPRIVLRFSAEGAVDKCTVDTYSGTVWFRYLRVGIRNTKSRVATGCRVFLIQVEVKGEGEAEYRDMGIVQPLQMAWANTTSKSAYDGLSIPSGPEFFADMVSAQDHGIGLVPAYDQTVYQDEMTWLHDGDFRFTLIATCAEGASDIIRVHFNSRAGTHQDRLTPKYLHSEYDIPACLLRR
jgi:hypothetical protein